MLNRHNSAQKPVSTSFMKLFFKYTTLLFLSFAVLTSCRSYRKLITDEVIMKDGNSQTGTITKCDTTSLRLKKADESTSVIEWKNIDTIVGKKLKTFWFGMNFGYYNTPYFSVFRNEPMVGRALGVQYKAGMAYRGNNMYYFNFSFTPAQPYAINKFGFGFQRYVGRANYTTKRNCFFWGSELNFMNVKYNNGSQTTLEPFTGYELKCLENIRAHVKFGLQFNLANKNSQTGVNISIGVHFIRKNFKERYTILNTEHRVVRR